MTPEQKAREILLQIVEPNLVFACDAKVIATAIREARNEALEEAMQVALTYKRPGRDLYEHMTEETAKGVAKRILALKDKDLTRA